MKTVAIMLTIIIRIALCINDVLTLKTKTLLIFLCWSVIISVFTSLLFSILSMYLLQYLLLYLVRLHSSEFFAQFYTSKPTCNVSPFIFRIALVSTVRIICFVWHVSRCLVLSLCIYLLDIMRSEMDPCLLLYISLIPITCYFCFRVLKLSALLYNFFLHFSVCILVVLLMLLNFYFYVSMRIFYCLVF